MLLSRTSTLSLRGRMWDDSVSSEGWTPSLPSRLLHDSLVDMQVASRQTLPYWVCDCKARRDTLQSALSIRLFLCVILRGTLANINQLIHIIFTDLSQINMLLSRAWKRPGYKNDTSGHRNQHSSQEPLDRYPCV
jgi:hypothetical protein